jgi:hypothetical protein
MPALIQPPIFLDRFRDILRSRGETAVQSPETSLARRGGDELFYTPFEHVNPNARLAMVGITPGPEQLKLAYRTVGSRLKVGQEDEEIRLEAKKQAAFGGPSMRPNLLKMMRHFGLAGILGIRDEEQLWGDEAGLFHATSVIPHAAFRNSKMFAGSFDDVLRSDVFREGFERDFVSSLRLMSDRTLYIGLGPTPLAALDWCAKRGLIRGNQVLGAFAHPSTSGGSQVDVYLGLKSPEDLSVGDPVRRRLQFLQPAYARMKGATDAVRGKPSLALAPSPPQPNGAARASALGAPKPNMAANPPSEKTAGVHLSKEPMSNRDAGNPLRDLIQAEMDHDPRLLQHPDRRIGGTKKVVIYNTTNGRTLALDKTSNGKQPIWTRASDVGHGCFPHIVGEAYQAERGRNSNLNVPELKGLALSRFYPQTLDEAKTIIDFVRDRAAI